MTGRTLTVLVTGANRGLGLAMARALFRRGHHVIAACRANADTTALEHLPHDGRLTLLSYDAHDPAAAQTLRDALERAGLKPDWLIANAGIGGLETLPEVATERMAEIYHVNAIAPVLLVRALADTLAQAPAPLVVLMGSVMGSVSLKEGEQDGTGADGYAYPASKAALHMLGTQLARDLRSAGICVISQSPGWARTDMGGPHAPQDPEEVGEQMVAFWSTVGLDASGGFFSEDGAALPYG